MYYSNKCQLFCTCEQLVGGKKGGMVRKLLLKPVNNDSYDEKLIINNDSCCRYS